MAGVQHSDPSVVNPFGGLPFRAANLAFTQQLSPLLRQFGYQHGRGPLAGLMEDVRGFAGGVGNQAQALGNLFGGYGQQAASSLNEQTQNFLSQLPGFQAASNQGLDYARQSAADAFSPVREQALFQRTAANVLDPIRQASAARGLLESGAGQAREENVLQDLGLNFAQNAFGREQAAVQGLQGAAQNAAGLGQAGIPAILAQLQGLPQAQNLAQQSFQLPMAASQALLNLLTAGQAGSLGLLQATAPQVSTESKGVRAL